MTKASKSQADFGSGFHLVRPRRIRYCTRYAGNWPHDLVYIGSYIHDALLDPRKVRLVRGRLTLPLARNTWELYQSLNELLSVPSVLRISPVDWFEWRFRTPPAESGQVPRRVCVTDIAHESQEWVQPDTCQMILHGVGGISLVAHVTEDFPDIRLEDRRRPRMTPSRKG